MPEALDLFLIEDESDIAFLMRKTLERAGHQVTICRTGADALMVLSHRPFSLVLLDQALPDMQGVELLRTLNREGITAPVLMVTGKGDERLAAEVLRAGALDYIVTDNALTFLADLPKRVQESVTRHRLQQTNRLLTLAIESASDGVMITDLEGTIQHVNSALERMTGYARQELLGQAPRLLNSGLNAPALFHDMWRTILARDSWQGELINKRKDGTLVDTSLSISPILDSRGQLTHFVGICRDISEHKLMQRQLFQAQKMQSVGTLAGGVAHEFNNLLAGIGGYASLGLREPNLSETAREFFQFIVNLSERAANLTRQLLAYARQPALSRQPTAMEKLLLSTADLVQSSLKIQVEVTVHKEGLRDDSLVALADANGLQQVLINLALNARDAYPASSEKQLVSGEALSPSPSSTGRAPVAFRLSRQILPAELSSFPENVPAGDYVLIEVEDHGCGMSTEVLARALDPFFTTKEVGRGTGLGLPVAFGIVHGHRGFLTFDTKVGEGTRVRLFLPRLRDKPAATGDPESEAESAESRAGTRAEQTGRHILVIDDETAVLDVVRRFLEIAGHRVSTATTGSEAAEILSKRPAVDLIVLDLMIPREEGTANFYRLRQRFPSIPVLLCTGLVQADHAEQLLRDGAADVLRKPFRMNELWQAVDRALA
jgi:PAS domain S-box-containing protein